MFAGAPRAARALHRAAHGDRQYPPAERADADHRAVARPRHRPAGHRDRDRRQSAPAVRQRTAGQGAVILFPRHSVGPRPNASTPSCARRRRMPRWRKCRCCAAASSPPTASPAENIKPKEDAAWVLQSDRGITYSGEIPAGSRLVEGQWWGQRLRRAAAGLVRKEDRRRPRPQARRSDHRQRARPQHHRNDRQYAHRRLAEPRHQFRDGVFAAAPSAARRTPISPRSPMPTAASPAQEAAVIRAVADAFPMVTTVRVKDALEAIGAIIANLVLGIRGASAITLLAAALVLGGALAAGHRHRVYDAVILKTLGATRLAAARRLYDRIPPARHRHRAFRRPERLARRLADRDRPDAPGLRLAALAGLGGGHGGALWSRWRWGWSAPLRRSARNRLRY